MLLFDRGAAGGGNSADSTGRRERVGLDGRVAVGVMDLCDVDGRRVFAASLADHRRVRSFFDPVYQPRKRVPPRNGNPM
jgi:hypothetical protein